MESSPPGCPPACGLPPCAESSVTRTPVNNARAPIKWSNLALTNLFLIVDSTVPSD